MILHIPSFRTGDSAGMAICEPGESINLAIQSGILAAEAIPSTTEYTCSDIPRYPFPSILGLRTMNHAIALYHA